MENYNSFLKFGVYVYALRFYIIFLTKFRNMPHLVVLITVELNDVIEDDNTELYYLFTITEFIKIVIRFFNIFLNKIFIKYNF